MGINWQTIDSEPQTGERLMLWDTGDDSVTIGRYSIVLSAWVNDNGNVITPSHWARIESPQRQDVVSEDDKPMKPPSPWQPISNQVHLAILGKSQEELGECVTVIGRCIIQGLDGKDPETGKVNIRWLEEEIADVRALSSLMIGHFGLDVERIRIRAQRKLDHKRAWLKLIT